MTTPMKTIVESIMPDDCEVSRTTVVIAPGPAVRGNANGTMAMSPSLENNSPFFVLSIPRATADQKNPASDLKCCDCDVEDLEHQVTGNHKEDKDYKGNLHRFTYSSFLSCGVHIFYQSNENGHCAEGLHDGDEGANGDKCESRDCQVF